MMNKPLISIIIPFLNEEENISKLVNAIDEYAKKQNSLQLEVIFVDDGSKDNSVYLLTQHPHINYEAKVIRLSKNVGSHAALRAGIMNAKGQYITFMYADLQDPIELINSMYEQCKNGNDIAWAVRSNSATGLSEKLFSKTYSSLMKRFAMANYPENGFDIVMFNAKVQHHLNANVESNSSIFLQILTLGFKQSSITYNKQARAGGKSKWTLSKKIKLFIDSFVAFSYFPIRLVSVVGISFFFLGLLWTGYIIGREMIYHDLSPGWPALISVLMLGFGITNIALGIIAEYLWRTLDASRKRPVYIIDEIIKLSETNAK